MYALPVAIPVVGAFLSSLGGGRVPIRNVAVDIRARKRVEADRAKVQEVVSLPPQPLQSNPVATGNVVRFDESAGRSMNGMGAQSVSRGLVAADSDSGVGVSIANAFKVHDQTLRIGGQGYDDEGVLGSNSMASGGQTITTATGGYIGKPLRTSRGVNDISIQKPSKVGSTVDEFYGSRWMPNRLPPHVQASYLREAQEQSNRRFQGQTVPRFNELGQAFAGGDELLNQKGLGVHPMYRPPVAHRTQTVRGLGDQMNDPGRATALPRVYTNHLGELGENTLVGVPDGWVEAKQSELLDRANLVNYGLQTDVAERHMRQPSAGQGMGHVVHPDVAERSMRKLEHRERHGWTDATGLGQGSRPQEYLPRLTRKINTESDLQEKTGMAKPPSVGVQGVRESTAESYAEIRERTMKRVAWSGELSGHAAIGHNVHADVQAAEGRVNAIPPEETRQTRIVTDFESNPMTGMSGKGAMAYASADNYEINESTRPVILVSGDRWSDPAQLSSLRDNKLMPQPIGPRD